MPQSVKRIKAGNWNNTAFQPPVDSLTSRYKREYPFNSKRKNGAVRNTMIGMAVNARQISNDIWFFKYLGWLKIFLSKTKTYDNEATKKYKIQPKSTVMISMVMNSRNKLPLLRKDWSAYSDNSKNEGGHFSVNIVLVLQRLDGIK